MTTESEAPVDSAAPPTRARRFDVLSLSGLVLTATAFAASAPEDPASASAAGLREHLAASAAAWQLYALLLAAAGAVAVLFFAHLRAVLVPAVRATGRASAMPDVAFGAGLLAAAWLLVSAGFTASTAFADLEAIDDTTLLSLWGLGEAGDMIGLATLTVKGLLMVAVGIVVLRTRVLAAWAGWLSLALGVLSWVGLIVPDAFYVGVYGFALWPLAISIALVARGLGRRGVPTTAP